MVAAVASTSTAFFMSDVLSKFSDLQLAVQAMVAHAEHLRDTRPPHVPAQSSGYHVLPVRTIALIGLKPVRRHKAPMSS